MKRLLSVLIFALLPVLAAGNVRLLVQPDDGVRPLIDLIDGAESSIRIKMYLWTPSRMDVVEALGRAVERGVNVRVLLEREPAGGRPSMEVISALRDRGVELRLSKPFRFVFVHEKSMVVDDRIAWFGSGNLTGSTFKANREYMIVTDRPDWVAEIARVFDADWRGERIDLSRARLVWSPDRVMRGVREGNAREKVLDLIRGARSTLFLEQAGMVDEEVIAALEDAVQRGVNVRLVGSPADPKENTYFVPGAERLREAGVQVRYLPSPYVHAKVIVADGNTALVGSINMSQTSMNANRELGAILTAADEPEAFFQLLRTMEADWKSARADNPFLLPPVEGVVPWTEAPKYYGRVVTVEGRIAAVESRTG
ncbi:phospholipase D-like domain-containing protein, partial [Oceanithermus sp.]|uniref:phospholipase D-like domain-containing protein n=1 Tax=Oceanithermus sp. TaxID=2268145 RepID=UPI0025DF9637